MNEVDFVRNMNASGGSAEMPSAPLASHNCYYNLVQNHTLQLWNKAETLCFTSGWI